MNDHSRATRRGLQAYHDVLAAPEIAADLDQLARAVGLARRQLEPLTLVADFPMRAPGGWPVRAVRAWIASRPGGGAA